MRALLLILLALNPASALADGKYDDMVRVSEARGQVVRQEGVNYMVGGGLGLGLAVALGVRTREALPKIGYSLIQVLSAAAIAHGASLYYQGDGLTQEGERLRSFAKQLEANGVPGPQRKKILDLHHRGAASQRDRALPAAAEDPRLPGAHERRGERRHARVLEEQELGEQLGARLHHPDQPGGGVYRPSRAERSVHGAGALLARPAARARARGARVQLPVLAL